MAEEKKTCEFRAEVSKVLSILTNSLYTNREIFLRELVSNASDALDKLRFRQTKGETPVKDDLPLEINISLDSEHKILTIADTGVGMTEQELGDNLGIIARSGSERFLADLAAEASDGKPADASQIIGRFGVGFYSVFMVASKVEVTSRSAFGGDAFTWESDGLGSYSISKSSSEEPVRGTKIVVYLKEDAEEYAEKYRIESVIRKHSAFVPFPVLVDGERVNTQAALWREPKSSVTAEQYEEFYKSFTYDNKAPLAHLHISVDSPVQFSALVYIPAEKQEILTADRENWGLDLYSRRILIQHQNRDLLPNYLAFMKGVVDTEDLPLNISRETLQENRVVMKINQTLVKQCLGQLEKIAKDDPEKYRAIWKKHGSIFKFSYQDFANKERTAALMRFNSSRSETADDLVSFDEYMGRGAEDQKTIWYVVAPNREAARLNPHMDRFRRKDIEVLFLYEPVDEFMMDGMGSYKEWTFKSIESASEEDLAKFEDKQVDEKKVAPLSEDDSRSFDALVARIKQILGERVKDVVVSTRLADSAACLVSPDGLTSSMDKFMRVMQKDDSAPVKNLELNKDHALLRSLLRIYKSDPQDKTLETMINALFDETQLMDGYVKDSQEVAARSASLLEQAAAWYAEVRKL